MLVVRIQARGDRLALTDGDTITGKGIDLARVVGHQLESADAEMLQHRHTDIVAAHVSPETEALIGFDGIGAAILQLIGANLVEQTDAAAFLTQIEQHAAAFGGNALERFLQLIAAVTAHREEGVAGQALGMHAAQHRRAVIDVAQGQGDVVLAGGLILETVHGEGRPGRWQPRGGDESNGHCSPRTPGQSPG